MSSPTTRFAAQIVVKFALILVTIPPVPKSETAPLAISSIFLSILSTRAINLASLLVLGFLSYKPSISEKLFQSIIQLTPFVVFGNPNYLARLHDKGFKTFGDIIDESYDTELDIKKRLDKFFVAAQQLVEVYDDPRVQSICEHNQKHFLNPYRINNELKEFYAEVNKVKKNV